MVVYSHCYGHLWFSIYGWNSRLYKYCLNTFYLVSCLEKWGVHETLFKLISLGSSYMLIQLYAVEFNLILFTLLMKIHSYFYFLKFSHPMAVWYVAPRATLPWSGTEVFLFFDSWGTQFIDGLKYQYGFLNKLSWRVYCVFWQNVLELLPNLNKEHFYLTDYIAQ